MSPLGYMILFGLIAFASGYTMRRYRDSEPAALQSENAESVTVRYRQERVYMGAVVMMAPFVVWKRAFDEYAKPDHGEGLGFLLLPLPLAAVGLWLFLFARRKMIFDKNGARLVGLVPRDIPWSDLGSIRALHGSMLRFNSRDGRRFIDIDASMQGWPVLIRELPSFAQGDAKKLVARALEEIRANAPPAA